MAYKYQTLSSELKAIADRMPERAQLPSVRNIMEVYGVSQATVDRAIDELRAQRIIESVEGEGFFVMSKGSRKRLPEHLKICLAQNDYPSTFFAMIEESFAKFYEGLGHEIQVVRYPWAKGLSAMLKPGLIDVFIAIPPAPELGERELDFIKALDIPAICLSSEAGRHGVDSIGTDYELGGMMAAEHLIRLGHARLAFLAGEPDTGSARAMFAGFRRQAQLSGLQEPLMIDCQTKPGDFAMRSSYLGFAKELGERHGQFTGLLCGSDCCAIGAIRACHEAGVKIPKDLSVIGFNGVPESEFAVPSITTLAHDIESWAKTSLEILRTRVEDGTTAQALKHIAPSLLVRESTSKPKGA